jgi:hypothetical protein
MLKKVAVSFFGLSLFSAGLCLATSLPITCFLDYYVSTSSGALSATARDRVCPVKVIFSNGSGTTGRTYSCTVLNGGTSCSITVDPSASGVPSGFTPQSAYTASIYSGTEEGLGCVYDVDYPYAQVSTMMGSTQVFAHHRFDCTSHP